MNATILGKTNIYYQHWTWPERWPYKCSLVDLLLGLVWLLELLGLLGLVGLGQVFGLVGLAKLVGLVGLVGSFGLVGIAELVRGNLHSLCVNCSQVSPTRGASHRWQEHAVQLAPPDVRRSRGGQLLQSPKGRETVKTETDRLLYCIVHRDRWTCGHICHQVAPISHVGICRFS